MKNCLICRSGETKPGLANITLQRSGATVIVKDVPAEICDNCGESYLDGDATDKVLRIAKDAVARGAEVEIVKFAA